MIKIHKRLWTVITNSEHKEPGLAYMTHADKEDSAFESRQSTGRGWAKTGYDDKETLKESFYDNTPTKGFEVIACVSRWSTSNKLFQVRDPRGFVVEIPSGNLSTLLQMTTVVNGVVEEECVWGREGNSHILLPTNSEPYQEGVNNMRVLGDMTAYNNLSIGDVVFTSAGDNTEQIFLGKVKLTWKQTLKQRKRKTGSDYRSWAEYENISDDDEVYSQGEFKDCRWAFLFRSADERSYGGHYWELKTTGKAYKTGDTKKVKLNLEDIRVDIPNRVYSKYAECEPYLNHGWNAGTYECSEVVAVEYKDG